MKIIYYLIILITIFLNGCNPSLEKTTKIVLPIDILKSCIDTNFLYEEPWDYLTRIGKQEIQDSIESKDYFKNRIQQYKGIEVLQMHQLEKRAGNTRIKYLDSILKQEGLKFNDSILFFHKYDLTKKTNRYFISETDTLHEQNHMNADSAIFCIYNFSPLIQPEPNRAYFFYEFLRAPKHGAGYIIILKRESKMDNWKLEKKILVWIS